MSLRARGLVFTFGCAGDEIGSSGRAAGSPLRDGSSKMGSMWKSAPGALQAGGTRGPRGHGAGVAPDAPLPTAAPPAWDPHAPRWARRPVHLTRRSLWDPPSFFKGKITSFPARQLPATAGPPPPVFSLLLTVTANQTASQRRLAGPGGARVVCSRERGRRQDVAVCARARVGRAVMCVRVHCMRARTSCARGCVCMVRARTCTPRLPEGRTLPCAASETPT